jgi:site-specific DNA-methyltransferase (adenine-specific)
MTRVEVIGNATLYLGDCRSIVPTLPRADLVVSDPPYRLTSGGKNGSGPSGGWMGDYVNDGAPVICDITWSEIARVVAAALVDNADAYLFANDKNVRPMLDAAHEAGLGFHNLLVWDKVNATANRWYMKNVEFVAYLWKGNARTINNPSSKQLIRAPQVDETKHPTEKPVGLCRHYIENSSAPGDLVLDPFMGSGTTVVAALRAGRRAVGVEQDPQWFDVACRRVERATATSGELFA